MSKIVARMSRGKTVTAFEFIGWEILPCTNIGVDVGYCSTPNKSPRIAMGL